MVFSCNPEDVSQSLQQTSNVQLSVSDKFPKYQDSRGDSAICFDISHTSSDTNLLMSLCSNSVRKHLLLLFPYLLTRAQCELLISRRSTQYPKMGLPLSLGWFQVTSMLLAVTSSTCGLSGASGGSKENEGMGQQKV